MKGNHLGITAPRGFQAAGVAAGIKKSGKPDMALIFSEAPCVTAGTFTTNVVKAAPVKWDQGVVYGGFSAQAVVINSGVANACTGQEGMDACAKSAAAASKALGIPAEGVLVASTGVIGAQIPVDKIEAGIVALAPALSDTREAAAEAAAAIMTTDTKAKEVSVSFELGGKTVSIGGMCKGSGMIHPNMCTMLSFLATDAAISKEMLQAALSETVEDSYNMISVDGDTSTNDTVLLLANGLAGNPEITEKGADYETFKEALAAINTELAKMIAGDGEGATALMEAKVSGAATKEDAKRMARAIISSDLSKAAIFGHDANWGRFLCAMGYSGATFDPDAADIFIESAAGRLQLVKGGMATDYSEEEASRILSEPEVRILADVHAGEGSATAWGCDLTYDYVKINADYRS